MNFPSVIGNRKVAGLVCATALGAGGLASGAVAVAGPASAQTCTTRAPGTVPCEITGTATLSSGVLSVTVPASLSWAATLSGAPATQYAVDSDLADQGYTVDDDTLSGNGWDVTASASTFVNQTTHDPDPAITLTTNGNPGAGGALDIAAPSVACGASGCTLPTEKGVAFPVTLTGQAVPQTIYDAATGTGQGSTVIGGSSAPHPVGWWIAFPGNTPPAVYKTVVTIAIASPGPTP